MQFCGNQHLPLANFNLNAFSRQRLSQLASQLDAYGTTDVVKRVIEMGKEILADNAANMCIEATQFRHVLQKYFKVRNRGSIQRQLANSAPRQGLVAGNG